MRLIRFGNIRRPFGDSIFGAHRVLRCTVVLAPSLHTLSIDPVAPAVNTHEDLASSEPDDVEGPAICGGSR
jgi:hypothetical protein